jgi:Annexin
MQRIWYRRKVRSFLENLLHPSNVNGLIKDDSFFYTILLQFINRQLIKAIGATTPDERCLVPIRYKALFGKELVDVMKSECGNKDFGTALQFLAVDPVTAECMMINAACKGAGTDELLLGTLICGRTNEEMDILKVRRSFGYPDVYLEQRSLGLSLTIALLFPILLQKKYFAVHNKDLGRKLDGELGGALEHLIFNVLQAAEEKYDPDFHNESKMVADVATLHKMGQGKILGTDERGLFKILCAAPTEYLTKLNTMYADKHGFTLVKVLETELGGHVEKAALFMIGMKLKPYDEVAKLIKKSCAGVGTNELLLTTAIIRYQSILKYVNLAHVELYGQTIRDRVESECGGDYKRVLLELIGAAKV